VAGGTWLAVDPAARSVSALLNGPRREPDGDGPRPTRGHLALRILTDAGLPDDLARYDRFHLLRATLDESELWTWDGVALTHTALTSGDHLVVNAGLDADEDALVPHFRPLLAASPSEPTAWRDLLTGDGLDPADDRALVVRKEIDGRTYGTTSGSLVALSDRDIHYDFTGTPADAGSWATVSLSAGSPVPPSP
jgi:hypothetical protein